MSEASTVRHRLADLPCRAPGPECETCPVRQQALFSVLHPSECERMREHVVHLTFGADESLYQRARPAHAVYTIRAGVVRFERPTAHGARRIVRLAGPGDLIGTEALLDLHQPTRPSPSPRSRRAGSRSRRSTS